MIKPWVLDTGPLGRLTHPARYPQIVIWLERQLAKGIAIIIPEIADYELRQSLRLENLERSIVRLDKLKTLLVYLPITTPVMLRAAELWADARRRGRPTADPQALDGDVILAAETLSIGGRVATENVGHLSLFVEATDWNVVEEK